MILRISKWLLPLALLCAFALPSFAQNTLTNDKALLNLNGYAAVVPNATITVCSSGGTGTPCSPKTTVCSSATDTTCSSPNPFTSDANGNYSFWEPPGTYIVSITAAGVTGYIIKYTIPCSVGTCAGGPGNLSQVNGGTAPSSQTYDFATNLDGVKVATPALSDDSTNAVNSAWVVSYLNTPGNLGVIYPTQIGDSTHPVQIWASAVDIDGPYYFFAATSTGTCPPITSPLVGGFLAVGPNGVPQEYNVNAATCQNISTISTSTPVAGHLPVFGTNYPAFDDTATYATITGLWSGSCSSSTYLRGDGACQVPSGSGTVVDGSGTTTPSELLLSTSTVHQYSIAATLPAAAMPALTGDVTNSAGSLATIVGKVNGASLPAS